MKDKARLLVEASGLLDVVLNGLVMSETSALGTSLVTFALDLDGTLETSEMDSIQVEAKEKYKTIPEQREVVLKALNILLSDYRRMNEWKKSIAEKAKTEIEQSSV
jgi:hypothetical protein